MAAKGVSKIVIVMALISLFLLIFANALADDETSQWQEIWHRRVEKLSSLPYIGFSPRQLAEEDGGGVVLHDPEKAFRGYNFYATKSSGEAYLLNMNGETVHRWSYLHLGGSGDYSHTVMLDIGDLLVINEGQVLFRIDWNSELIWRKELRAHHDAVQLPDGSLLVIVKELKNYRGIEVFFDAIVHLTADGEEIDRWSTYKRLDELKSTLDPRSFLDNIIDNAPHDSGETDRRLQIIMDKIQQGLGELDYFHMNTVSLIPATVLGECDSRFQQGNLLVCFRNVNQIAVLEKCTYRVLWAWGEGELEWPHHPTMLENGHILIFDNLVDHEYSRVLELDPATETIVWEYTAEEPEFFRSAVAGSAQRLPNGNTLICEHEEGRVFEVTKKGARVWIWLNPLVQRNRRGTVYRMLRLPAEQGEEMLRRGWWWR